MPSVSSGDVTSRSASGHQTAWFGAPGQMSMADIVKMDRPQNKTKNSRDNVNMRSEINHEHEINANQQVPVKDEWPSIEKPVAPSTSSVSIAPAESEIRNGPADFQSDRGDQHVDRLENIHLEENGLSENLGVHHVQHDSIAGGVVQEDDSGVSSEFDDNGYKYQTQSHPVECHKGNILNMYKCFLLMAYVNTLWSYVVNDNVSIVGRSVTLGMFWCSGWCLIHTVSLLLFR